jgi:ABC-type xylose transport system permease subunit
LCGIVGALCGIAGALCGIAGAVCGIAGALCGIAGALCGTAGGFETGFENSPAFSIRRNRASEESAAGLGTLILLGSAGTAPGNKLTVSPCAVAYVLAPALPCMHATAKAGQRYGERRRRREAIRIRKAETKKCCVRRWGAPITRSSVWPCGASRGAPPAHCLARGLRSRGPSRLVCRRRTNNSQPA